MALFYLGLSFVLAVAPAPPLSHANPIEARAAHWAHVGLYGMLFTFPLSGFNRDRDAVRRMLR